jgi:hypothetical protein
MRVLDTATILAAMAQVSPRPRRGPGTAVGAQATSPAPAPRARSCHRPKATPADREPGDHDDGPRAPRPSSLVVVPQGVVPVIVVSSRLAAASRASFAR